LKLKKGSIMNPWFLLSLTIVSEVVGIYCQKLSNGYERITPTIIMAACYLFAAWGVGIVMKHLDMGITYAIWAGAGTALAAIMGVFFFNESFGAMKIAGVVLIVVGVVLLNGAAKIG
jgi:small multidrug resistance pump